MANEIICDACKAIIKTQRIKIKEWAIGTDKEGNKVKARTFECTNCGKRYLVALIDSEMQKKDQQTQKNPREYQEGEPENKSIDPEVDGRGRAA